MKPAKEINC